MTRRASDFIGYGKPIKCPECDGEMDNIQCTVCGLTWEDIEAAADMYDQVTSKRKTVK